MNNISYNINLARLKLKKDKTKQKGRFDNYTPFCKSSKFHVSGILHNDTDWNLSTPNCERAENISVVASNTIDKSSLRLQFKWRPDPGLKVATLLSKLNVETEDKSLVYRDVATYLPTKSPLHPDRIVQYGAKGSCLRLIVIEPYRRYRLVFRGEMLSRDSGGSEQTAYFVKLNILIIQTSKVFDFKHQYDERDVANAVANQKPECGLFTALNELILHDKHEHAVRLTGEYSMQSLDESFKTSDKLHLWGFHSRHFVDDSTQKVKSKQILAMFRNGRAFHVGVRETNENKHFQYGYACFGLGPSVDLATARSSDGKDLLDWKNLKGSDNNFEFNVTAQGLSFDVRAEKRTSSDFMDMTIDSKSKGWGLLTTDDSIDTTDEIADINSSLQHYREELDSGSIVDSLSTCTLDSESGKPLAVNIDDPKCLSPSLVGAKASSLAQLRSLSKSSKSAHLGPAYVVPSAIVLTRFAYDEIMAANPILCNEIQRLTARIGDGDLQDLEKQCQQIVDLFKVKAKLAPQVVDQLKQHAESILSLEKVDNLGNGEAPPALIVRSSSWGEDEDDVSAAGQLSSVLSVRGFDRLQEAVLECFASKFSYQNIEYKRQHGLALDSPMAVIVQEQINCDRAGVMFTCDPVTGNPSELLITANYGLGESVVSAKTDPDSIQLRAMTTKHQKPTAELQKTFVLDKVNIGKKNNIITEKKLDNMDRKKCCLNKDESIKLAQCGARLAHFFRQPCDIEWGMKNGHLYLFQSRPITGLDSYTEYELLHEADEPSRSEVDYLSRCNVNEIMPYALSPLYVSLLCQVYKVVSFKTCRRVGLYRLEDYSAHYNRIFVIMVYHSYLGLRDAGLFDFSSKPGKEKSLDARSVELALFGREIYHEELAAAANEMLPADADKSKNDPAIVLSKLKFVASNWGAINNPEKDIAKIRKKHKKLRRKVRSLKMTSKKGKPQGDLKGLWFQVKKMTDYVDRPFNVHRIVSKVGRDNNLNLMLHLEKCLKEPSMLNAVLSKILAASPNVLSGDISLRIKKIAQSIIAKGANVAESFVSMPSNDALEFITSDKGDLSQQYNTFMVKFGHRCYNEFELKQSPWRETPEIIIDLIKTNVASLLRREQSGESSSKADKKPAFQLEPSDLKSYRWNNFKLRHFTGARSQRFVAAREQTKDLLMELTDIVRDACRLLTKALLEAHRIPDEDLFYYLFVHEVEPLIRDHQPSIVAQAIRRRKMFKKMFKCKWCFDEIICVEKDVVPDHLRKSDETELAVDPTAKLVGVSASAGKVRGKVCLIENYRELSKVEANDIVVTYSTDIAFAPIFPIISGIVTEVGGLISHGAVVAREYGLPSVIGIRNVTKLLKHGEEIVLDADNGVIIRLPNQVNQ